MHFSLLLTHASRFDDGTADSDTGSPSPPTIRNNHHHHVQGPTVAGVVIGALVALCIIGVIIFVRRRHRRTAAVLDEQLRPIAFRRGNENAMNPNAITSASAFIKNTSFAPESRRKKDQYYPSSESHEPLPPLPSGPFARPMSDTPPAYNFNASQL